jgi:hypothetical protein
VFVSWRRSALAPSLKPVHLPVSTLEIMRLPTFLTATRDFRPSPRKLRDARPTAAYITRLTLTATFAYLVALAVPAGTDRPVLAPLTALLVLQASLYQTIRSGLRKVLSVTAGVLFAVAVTSFIGFSWWQLGLVIGGALVIGWMLRLGDDLLEVPISAMLIFSSAGPHAAASGRIIDTLVGAGAGLAGGLVFASPQVQPAREAVGDLAARLATLLDKMAADLTGRADETATCSAEWLSQARALRDQIEHVDDTLREAIDSVRLNPRSRLGHVGSELPATEVALRGGVEALEHATVTIRGLARSVLDSAGVDSQLSPVRDERTRERLAAVLGKLAAAIRTYGELVQTMPSGNEELEASLAERLAEAHELQDRLAEVLEPRAAAVPAAAAFAMGSANGDRAGLDGFTGDRANGDGSGGDGAGRDDLERAWVPAGVAATEWPLRGELLVHVDRLRTGLRADTIPRQPVPAAPHWRPRLPPKPRMPNWQGAGYVSPVERLDRAIGRFEAQRRMNGMR